MVQSFNATGNYSLPKVDINKEDVQQTIAKSSQVVSDSFESNSAVKTISSSADDGGFSQAAPLVPLLYVVDKFLDGRMAGDTKTNVLGKAAKLGDNIYDKFHLEKFLSPEKLATTKKKISENTFTKYFTNTYKATPICSMAKSSTFAETMASKLDDEAQKVVSKLAEAVANPEGLDELLSSGISEKTKQAIKDIGTDKTFSTKQILDIVDDFADNGIQIVDKNFSSIRNKAAAAASKVGDTTLGKAFSKGVVRTKDIATYGGGLISLFFMASSIMNAVKATKEAPKGEKKATFMHVLSEQYLGMILFQPSINLVYKAAGNKYRGMTESGKKALTDLVTKTNIDETLSKEGLKVAKMQRKLLLKGVDETKVADLAGKGLKEAKQIAKTLKKDGAKLKFWEKPLKAAGSILGLGLDKMKTPKFATIAGKKIKIPQPTLKGFVGGLGRFALIMFVVQPLIQKPITKLCHKIFGEPKAYLAKQNASNGEDSKSNGDINNLEAQKVSEQNSLESFDPSKSSDTNLIKKWTQLPEEQATVASTPVHSSDSQPIKPQQAQDEIAALNIFDKDKKQDRYIPSIEPYVPQDNSAELDAKVNSILKSTDSVVQKTRKYL
ncbi:MAG: hypothetical protein IJY61_07040 [Candidatus Gastranaerophilales bacterium]|nr:hypothetical protein [Candidatus Gastranaerophilales bacterium]